MPKLLPDGPIDTLGVLDALLALPDQIDDAVDSGPVAGLPPATSLDHIVVVGGGSLGHAAQLAAAVVAPTATVPVIVHDASSLPAFVAGRSAVVILDLDDDPHAIELATAARDAGASVISIGAEGGELLQLAADSGDPAVVNRSDVPVTRAAVGAAAVHVLTVFEQMGLYAELAESVEAAILQLQRRRDELTASDSPAARLARRIGRTLPVVYGADVVGGVAANRWKHMVNRNAKAAAFASSLPALGHDEIAGWGQHGDMTRQVFTLITLRHDHEPAGAAERFALVEEMVDEVVHERHEVRAEGDGTLAQLLDLSFYGDIVSWHLAQELEIDPGPDAAVDALRAAVWSKP